MTYEGKQLLTTLAGDGTLTVEIAPREWDAPTGSGILVKVEAAPINPSDLGLLFASADTDNAQYSPGKVVAKMPEAATRAMKARHGISMPAGNECAGTVVAAGEAVEAVEAGEVDAATGGGVGASISFGAGLASCLASASSRSSTWMG